MMCNDNVNEEIMLWISEWAHFLIKLWPRGNNGPFPPHPSPLCLKQLEAQKVSLEGTQALRGERRSSCTRSREGGLRARALTPAARLTHECASDPPPAQPAARGAHHCCRVRIGWWGQGGDASVMGPRRHGCGNRYALLRRLSSSTTMGTWIRRRLPPWVRVGSCARRPWMT